MKNKIPLFKSEIDNDDVGSIVKSLEYSIEEQSNMVISFEESLKKFVNDYEVAVVSSGTAALHLSFMALGLSKGDTIFIPDFGWPSATNVALIMGLRVVLVDVDLANLNMNVQDLENKIINSLDNQEEIKAIVHIHQFGLVTNIHESIKISKKYSLHLIEDAACALGAEYENKYAGTFGDIAIFSFHPRKSITTGEGGAVVSKNTEYINEIKVLRNHGQTFVDKKRIFTAPGLNYRISYIQAALGISQLKKLPRILANRKSIALTYHSNFQTLKKHIILPENLESHSWQTFSFTLRDHTHTEALLDYYMHHKINAILSSSGSSNVINSNNPSINNTPISNYLLKNNIAIPLYPSLTKFQINKVIDLTIKFFKDK
jgi:dTDP-4-amino-4,6-dideoxygalactose transaminase